jgi:hypothetical protein
MAVPTTITDLSTTAASNSPSGSESIGTSLDDYLRSVQAIIKQGVSKGSDITAAATITPVATSSYFVVTGNTGITAIGETYSWVGRIVVLKFSGTPLLTHAAGLILPGAANITAAAGDVAAFVNESAGVWRCIYGFGLLKSGGNLTGVLGLSAGTALLPALIPSGDPNTGVWFPAADTVAVSTGGVERLRIASGGEQTQTANAIDGITNKYNARTSDNYGVVNHYNFDGTTLQASFSWSASETRYTVVNGVATFYTGATERMKIDASGNVLVNSVAGLGYGTGAGGTVTQGSGSGKQTGVTLNKPTGVITLDTGNLNAGATVSFLFTNSILAASDVLIVNMRRGTGTAGGYSLVAEVTAGLANIVIKNETAGNLAEGFQINFAVIKGVTS